MVRLVCQTFSFFKYWSPYVDYHGSLVAPRGREAFGAYEGVEELLNRII